MYDMYPWDSAGQGEYPPQPLRSVRNPARNPARRALNGHARDISPAQALQIALDRRDNGGEGHPASRAAPLPAASTVPAASTMPAASQARQ